jgi:hypothetical protein
MHERYSPQRREISRARRTIKLMHTEPKRTCVHALSEDELNPQLEARIRSARGCGSFERAGLSRHTQRLDLQLLLADHHAGRKPHCRCESDRRHFHEGTPSCEPPNSSKPLALHDLAVAEREPEPGVLTRELQTGDSQRETAQTLSHNAQTEDQQKPIKRRACCWLWRGADTSASTPHTSRPTAQRHRAA